MSAFTSPPLEVEVPEAGFTRADITFEGAEQAGPSFEGRVFLNNPHADGSTERSPEAGFAGAFHLYGFGQPEPESATRPGAGGASQAREPITVSAVANP